MTDQETHPAGNEAETNPTSLTDILGGDNAPQGPEAGSGDGQFEGADADDLAADAAAAAAIAAPPANAEPKPEPAPAGNAGAKPEAEQPPANAGPKWYRDHINRVNAELAELRRRDQERAAQQPQPQQRREHQPAADPLADPEGYHASIQESIRREFGAFQLQTTLTLSERFARQQHGNDAFEECRAWLSTKPDIEQWAIRQPDPWSAAFTQYQRERLVEEVGDDPAAYRKQIEDQIRAEIMAEMQREPAPANPQMRAQPSAPPPQAASVRSAAPRDGQGRFAGPTPLSAVLGNK